MTIRRLAHIGLLLVLLGSLTSASSPVPRRSPELTIAVPDGRDLRLSSLKGKVVVVEFLVTKCPHCMRVAQTLAKLDWDLGSHGLQIVGVAFDPGVNGATVKEFTQQFAVRYPVGYVSSDKVDLFLGREENQRFAVPQIVVIDRAGTIRAQSRPLGERNLEEEGYLRTLLDGLLREGQSKPRG